MTQQWAPRKHRFTAYRTSVPNARIVAIKELMWTYLSFQKNGRQFKDRKTIESADILVQTNTPKAAKKERKLGHIYPVCDRP